MPASKWKILVVDDDPSMRNSLFHIFTGRGYSVRSVEDGFSALTEILNDVPDLVLSDLQMPGMSGTELLSTIRLRFPSIPLVAMSSAFSGNGLPPGLVADAFYEKATDLSSLFELIETVGTAARGR